MKRGDLYINKSGQTVIILSIDRTGSVLFDHYDPEYDDEQMELYLIALDSLRSYYRLPMDIFLYGHVDKKIASTELWKALNGEWK